MVDLNSMLFEDVPARDDTVVELPNLVEGRLADLLALASAPGSRAELGGEHAARSLFQSVSESWPKARRRGRPVRVAIVAASVATLFGTTTALAAASALPAPAARVVDGALHQMDINVARPPSSPVSTGTNALGAGTGAVVRTGAAASSKHPTTQHPVVTTGACHHTGTTAGTSTVHTGSEPCGAHKATVGHSASGSAGLALYRELSKEAAANHQSGGNKTTGSVHKSGTGSRGVNQGTGSGSGSASGSGTGGSRGGNQGTGSGSGSGDKGSGTGTGGSRGGNQGTGSGGKGGGSGSGSGTGGNRGGSTGSGGKGGTGRNKGGHRTRHGDQGSGTKHHHHAKAVQKQPGARSTITYGEIAPAD